jgi:phosphatidylinositol-4,5-bisphosphate 3-kinase
MDGLWRASGLELGVLPYGCVSTGDEVGFLEIVLDSETVGNIHQGAVDPSASGYRRKMQAAKAAYRPDIIAKWLRGEVAKRNRGGGGGGDSARLRETALAAGRALQRKSMSLGSFSASDAGGMAAASPRPSMAWRRSRNDPYSHAQSVFARSSAGYAVATYVMGIGDRHSDNVMIRRDGTFFHIDFGHFLGNFKYKFGIKRERSPVLFTPAMAYVLGSEDGEPFKEFMELAKAAYLELRRHANLIITLFSLMLSCGIPELTRDTDIHWIRDKLMLHLDEPAAEAHIEEVLHAAIHTKAIQHNDAAHMLKHA